MSVKQYPFIYECAKRKREGALLLFSVVDLRKRLVARKGQAVDAKVSSLVVPLLSLAVWPMMRSLSCLLSVSLIRPLPVTHHLLLVRRKLLVCC